MQTRAETRSSYFTSSIIEPYKFVNLAVWVIISIVAVFFAWLSLFHSPNLDRSDFLKLEDSHITSRLVVTFLTSEATSWRNSVHLAQFVQSAASPDSQVFAYVTSDSKMAIETVATGILTPNCVGLLGDSIRTACYVDTAFTHFKNQTEADWILIAPDNVYLRSTNLMKLISALEQIHNPRKDALVLGQRHFDRDQSYPHGGPGLLFSRAFVNEFIRRNVSFQRILAGNARKTYDVATGMLVLNEFSDAVWIDHPWLCIGAPETESLEVLGKRTWRELEKCPTDPGEGRAFVRLQDVVQFHIIPFKTETAGYVKNAEFAPEQVKLYRPTAYGVRFCWMDVDDNVAEIDSEWIPKFVVDKEAVKRRDAANV